MLNFFLICIGKLISNFLQTFNLGSGSTWPGHIALNINPHFIKDLLTKSKIKTILIAGTNGKTTTAKLINTALSANGKKVIQNQAGANLLNGIASTLLLNSSITGKLNYDYAIFEVDENNIPPLLKEVSPDYLLFLNLFRDQLDRYGEINTIANNWKDALKKLTRKTTLILNADDPQIAYLSKNTDANIIFFGLQASQFAIDKTQHAADSNYCPKCGEKLIYNNTSYSHLGNWHCKKCGLKRPDVENDKFVVYPMPGLYNKYNVLAAALLLKQTGLNIEQINSAFSEFTPAFGRQEIIQYKGKNIQVFLSKNPTSFNESYRTIQELDGPVHRSLGEGGKTLLLILNDRIPDGRDVSWIWDIDLFELNRFKQIIISGDRVYDMGLRIKYENYKNFHIFENLEEAIETSIKQIETDETLFILPTYSAMLDVRKIITGKKIL